MVDQEYTDRLVASPRPRAILSGELPRVCYSLVLQPAQKFGSMEEQLVLLSHAFKKEGSFFLPLFICTAEDAVLTNFQERNVAAECLELRRFSWKSLFAMVRLIRAYNIDVLHWNFTPPLTNYFVWWLTVLCPRVRHWFTDHNSRILPLPAPPKTWKKTVKRYLLSRYSRVVCVSQYVKQCLEEQGTWSNLVCLTHFINTDRFEPDMRGRQEMRERWQVGDRFVMLVVGQLIKEKGIDVAIRALNELPANVVLWIIGAGQGQREEADLQSLIASLGLDGRVRMFGLASNVKPYLQAADCFVCPSLWAEAAGLVNLEAQSCGLPVVASRIGGIPEYVIDEHSGLLFEPGNASALAAHVQRLADDAAFREQMARHARAWALQQFSPDVRLPEILDLYRKERPWPTRP